MNAHLKSCLALALAGLSALPQTTRAEGDVAFCEVVERGEKAPNATGYCTVTQREGVVAIRLADGESVELGPGEQDGRMYDQDGEAVEHEVKSDGSHYYAWAQRNITVYFNRAEGLYY